MRYDCEIDEAPERLEEHECCVGVVCVPRNLGGVTLQSHAEAVCRCGHHRVTETEKWRTVTHKSSHNIEWQRWLG